MSESEQNWPARRHKTRALIDNMLAQRDEMLVLLWKVSGRDPDAPSRLEKALLQQFIGILVDYIAAAHFGLYQRIDAGSERRQAVTDKAQHLYPRIAQTTQAAVDFSDKYDGNNDSSTMNGLADDIAKLSEELIARIDLEDQLIEAMLGVTVEALQTSTG